MVKKPLILIALFLSSILMVACHNDSSVVSSNKIVFFYSNKCPHCEKVRVYFTNNGIANKVKFSQKEVLDNRGNLIELVKVMHQCDIPVHGYIEVPLLWTGSKCLTGSDNIIQFFNGKLQK